MKGHAVHRESANGFAQTMQPPEVEALRLLQAATGFIDGAAEQRWQSAVDRHYLAAVGANDPVIRQLLRQGLVEHRVETTRPGARRRTFRKAGALLKHRSCFVLTDLGRTWAQAVPAAGEGGGEPLDGRRPRRRKPHWDAANGNLMVDGTVLHHYRRQARNPVAILVAFEECKWPRLPEWLDDPLPGNGDLDRERRLYEAVAALNCNQEPQLVEFMINQEKTAVGWRWQES
jgi:hypothetical protein